MKRVETVKLRLSDNRWSLCFVFGAAAFLAIFTPESRAAKNDSLTPAELFSLTTVYTAHFHFTAEQWDAMEPETGENNFRGPRPGPAGGGPGRPGGPGGPGGRPPAFGPGMFLAPAFFNSGDANKDGKLSAAEFEGLGAQWFAAWDKDKAGKLDADKLRDGMNASLSGPGGGMGGGMPRIQLQGQDGKRNGLASAMGVEFDYVKADLEFADRKFTNVAVRYKGNGTWMMSQGSIKRSMKVDLNEFVKGQKIAGVTKLNFHNAVTDGSWMNEVLSHAFYRDAGVLAPRTAFARVYVTVPGKHDKRYLGLYSLVENIDDNFTDERFGTSKGSLFKPVTHSLFADFGDEWSKYQQAYDPKDSPPAAHTQRVIDFAKLVTHASDEEFAAKVPEYLDLENFSRFMAGTVWLSTLDSILAVGQNYYMYLDPKTRKFQFFPWDLDHSFGQFFLMGDQAQRNELSIQKPWRGENRFLERVFKVEEFKKLYQARLKEINETIGRPERITKQVDQVAAAIRPAVKQESEDKLARFDKATAGESFEPVRMGPGGPPGMNMGVQPIKKFVVERNKSVEAQLAGKSQGADMETPPPGMPRNFGPGTFLGPGLVVKFDADKDGNLSRDEFISGFSKWFAAWDKEKSGALEEEQIRTALNEEFAPPGGFRPGGGGGGPRPGGPPQ
ncbi:MAG: CotH kinase family protein [Limisphaerales bacterium]